MNSASTLREPKYELAEVQEYNNAEKRPLGVENMNVERRLRIVARLHPIERTHDQEYISPIPTLLGVVALRATVVDRPTFDGDEEGDALLPCDILLRDTHNPTMKERYKSVGVDLRYHSMDKSLALPNNISRLAIGDAAYYISAGYVSRDPYLSPSIDARAEMLIDEYSAAYRPRVSSTK